MTAAPLLLATALAAGPEVGDGAADRWPRFRGPGGAGQAPGWRLPADFETAAPAWTAALPGSGVSSPVAWGDAVFVTSANGPDRTLTRLDAQTGAVAWTKPAAVNPAGSPADPSLHAKNDPAAATPAVDADRVYTLFSDGPRLVAAAFTHEGEEVWRRDLGGFDGQHGHGVSPVRVNVRGKELLVVANEQDAAGAVLALDAATGGTVWNTPRPAAVAAYATPVPFRSDDLNGGAPALLTASSATGLSALDAATGAELWNTGPVEPRVVASPVIAGGRAWFLCGSGGAGKLLVGADPATGAVVAEETRGLPYVPTPVEAGGRLWLWGDRGTVVVLAPKTAGKVWQGRVGGNFSASPVVVGDAVVNVSEAGELVAVNVSPPFGVRGRRDLGSPTNATVAVAGGRLLVRLGDRLVALDLDPFDPRRPRR